MLMWIVPWMRAVLWTESFSLRVGPAEADEVRHLLAVHVDDADRLAAVEGKGRAAPGLEHLVAKDRTGRAGRRHVASLRAESHGEPLRAQGSPTRPGPAMQRNARLRRVRAGNAGTGVE